MGCDGDAFAGKALRPVVRLSVIADAGAASHIDASDGNHTGRSEAKVTLSVSCARERVSCVYVWGVYEQQSHAAGVELGLTAAAEQQADGRVAAQQSSQHLHQTHQQQARTVRSQVRATQVLPVSHLYRCVFT